MFRAPLASRACRPQLEALEGRDLPSAVTTTGAAFVLTPALVARQLGTFDSQVNSLTTAINNDFHGLQSAVSSLTASGLPSLPANTFPGDYNKVAQDYKAIAALDTQIHQDQARATTDAIFLFASSQNIVVSSAVVFAIEGALNSAAATADGALAHARGIINTSPGNGAPTVASVEHL
jgi:hypothetical protein